MLYIDANHTELVGWSFRPIHFSTESHFLCRGIASQPWRRMISWINSINSIPDDRVIWFFKEKLYKERTSCHITPKRNENLSVSLKQSIEYNSLICSWRWTKIVDGGAEIPVGIGSSKSSYRSRTTWMASLIAVWVGKPWDLTSPHQIGWCR